MAFSVSFPRSLRARILVLVALPTLVELLLVAKLTNLQWRAESTLQSGQHYAEVLKALNQLNVRFLESDAEFLGTKLEKGSMQGLLSKVNKNIHELDLAISPLRNLIKDDPEAVNLLEGVVSLRDEMAKTMRSYARGWIEGNSTDTQRREDSRKLVFLARKTVSAVVLLQTDVEELQFKRYAQSVKFKSEERNVLVGLAVINAFFCMVAIFALSDDASKRLGSLLANMRRYAANEPLILPKEGTDEIAFLEDVFYKAAEELQNARRKEQAFIDESHDPIIFVGEDLRIVFANGSAQNHYGMSVGLRMSEKVPAVGPIKAFLKQVQSGTLRTTQIELLAKEGNRQAILSAVWEADARCYFCIIHDITERIKIEQMRSDLVSMFTHDLKSPLTSLSLNLNILEDENLSDGQKTTLSKAYTSVRRMSNLVTDLLDLYKTEAGMMHFDSETFDMRALALSVKEEFATIAESLNVSVELTSNDSSALLAKGSAEASRRVLANLLGNALKFSPQSGLVTIDASATNNLVSLKITDAGPGIREENLPLLFEKFHQFSSFPKSKISGFGSGLGLAICKTFAERQGGSVSVKSKLGEGSVFTFSLPAAQLD